MSDSVVKGSCSSSLMRGDISFAFFIFLTKAFKIVLFPVNINILFHSLVSRLFSHLHALLRDLLLDGGRGCSASSLRLRMPSLGQG